MIRNEGETYQGFIIRATEALNIGAINLKEWAECCVGDGDIYSSETLRRCAKYFSEVVENMKKDLIASSSIGNDEIKSILDKIEKEKIKVRTANLEYNQNKRNEARDELFHEQLIDAIKRLPKIEIKERLTPHKESEYNAVLVISDIHAGADFEVKGYGNEIVNKYSFDIMKQRMWKIRDRLVSDLPIRVNGITIAFCGDIIEGILRESSLTKLKEPMIDTVIKTSEFLSQWILSVQEETELPINVVIIGGNHDVMRYLTSKPVFSEENYAKIIREFIYLRLQNNHNIIVDEYTDVAIKTIKMNNIMFYHGEDRNLTSALTYFENLYNISIDCVYAGHFHSTGSSSCGITDVGDRQVYRVGSIMGIDPYAKSIRAASRPSCHLALYSKDGKDWCKDIYL